MRVLKLLFCGQMRGGFCGVCVVYGGDRLLLESGSCVYVFVKWVRIGCVYGDG